MSFLNLMKNRLKPKEVNDALMNGLVPVHSASDVGKVVAISDTGGLELITPYTPPAYSSTEEVNTGQKWIDGSDIYIKYISGNTPDSGSGAQTIQTINDVSSIIELTLFAVTSGVFIPAVNSVVGVQPRCILSSQTHIANITLSEPTSATYQNKPVYGYIRYTKIVSTREDSEPEPETKSRKKSKKL